jgi:hypothetical protein
MWSWLKYLFEILTVLFQGLIKDINHRFYKGMDERWNRRLCYEDLYGYYI